MSKKPHNLEICLNPEPPKPDQLIFSASFCSGRYSRTLTEPQLIGCDELDEILRSCERVTGNFLCTRFVSLLIISFSITAAVLLIQAFYFTAIKADRDSIIYTYVFAIVFGVFFNLLLFLLYLLIIYIYEKQINLYLGQRKIEESFERRNLFWRANGTKLTLNMIYSRREHESGAYRIDQARGLNEIQGFYGESKGDI